MFAVPDVTPPFHPLSWVGLHRAALQAPAPGTGASRQSGPDDPSSATCCPGLFTDGDAMGVSSRWTIPAGARGSHRTPFRLFSGRGLPGDGRTCFPPSGAQELGSPTSLRLRRQTSCIMTVFTNRHGNNAPTLCKNRAEKSALILDSATRNFLDFVRNYHFPWNHVWTSQCYADQSLDRRYRTSRLAASRRAE